MYDRPFLPRNLNYLVFFQNKTETQSAFLFLLYMKLNENWEMS